MWETVINKCLINFDNAEWINAEPIDSANPDDAAWQVVAIMVSGCKHVLHVGARYHCERFRDNLGNDLTAAGWFGKKRSNSPSAA